MELRDIYNMVLYKTPMTRWEGKRDRWRRREKKDEEGLTKRKKSHRSGW
jgi:hypothetical protein